MTFNKLERHDNFKWKLLEGAVFEGKYDMPVLQPTYQMPHDLVCFHMAKSIKNPENSWFHFYEDDYQFERVWNRPLQYLSTLQKFAGGISPDFSIYLDMPRSQQIWNCWRNRTLAYWLQLNGINIVPEEGTVAIYLPHHSNSAAGREFAVKGFNGALRKGNVSGHVEVWFSDKTKIDLN